MAYSHFKDTCWLWCKNSKNLQLLDIQACISANKPSFQNLTNIVGWPTSKKGLKDALLTELQARMSRSCRFLLFLPLASILKSLSLKDQPYYLYFIQFMLQRMRCKFYIYLPMSKSEHYWDQCMPTSENHFPAMAHITTPMQIFASFLGK